MADSDRHSRIRRWVFFPLALLYALTLVTGAWPNELNPAGVFNAMIARANWALSQVAVPAGLAVFTGRGYRSRVTLRRCFRISGYRGQQRTILFDSMDHCREDKRDIFKDPVEAYHRNMLGRAFEHLQLPGSHRDRNTFPLNVLFSIADYYCHRDGAPYDAVLFAGRHQKIEVAGGSPHDQLVVHGLHHCSEGRWEPLGVTKEIGGGKQ